MEIQSGSADLRSSVLLLGTGRSQWLPRAPWLLLTPPQCLSLQRAATGPSAGMEKHQGTYLSLSHMNVSKATAGVSPPWHCSAHSNFSLTLCCAHRQQSLMGVLGTPILQSQRVCQPWPGLWVTSRGRVAGARSWQCSSIDPESVETAHGTPVHPGGHRGVDASGFRLPFHCSQPGHVAIQI